MTFKNINLKELKEKYSGRHGFVFQGASPCDSKYCEVIANQVKNRGFTESLPEFIVQLDNRTFVFVYPETALFESGSFYAEASKFSMMGHFQIDMLLSFLQNN